MHRSLVTKKGFNYIGFGVLLLISGLFTNLVFTFSVVYLLLLFVALFIEYRDLYSSNEIEVELSTRKNEVVDTEIEIDFIINIKSKRYREIDFIFSEVDLPQDLKSIELISVDKINNNLFKCLYRVRTVFYKIGSYKFDNIIINASSNNGLWSRQFVLPELKGIQHIWPKKDKISEDDLKKIFQEQAFLGKRTGLAKFNISRDVFSGMRDYQYGDSLRVIDAKKSARYGRPITKTYEEIKSNNIFLFIDLGRNMEGRLGESELMNFYFYVMLSIAETALSLGDKVTLCGISDKVEFIFPNLNSLSSLKTIMGNAHNFKTKHTQTNYHLVNRILEKHHVRRSMVILLSDFTKPSVQESIREVINYISIKHIPLMLSLLDDDYDIEKIVNKNVSNSDEYKKLIYSITIKDKLEMFSSEVSTRGAFHFNVTSSKWMDFAPKAFKMVRSSFIS